MKEMILVALKQANDFVSTQRLANLVDAPEASVRRCIQTLRKMGYNISFNDGDGYKLWS